MPAAVSGPRKTALSVAGWASSGEAETGWADAAIAASGTNGRRAVTSRFVSMNRLQRVECESGGGCRFAPQGWDGIGTRCTARRFVAVDESDRFAVAEIQTR